MSETSKTLEHEVACFFSGKIVRDQDGMLHEVDHESAMESARRIIAKVESALEARHAEELARLRTELDSERLTKNEVRKQLRETIDKKETAIENAKREAYEETLNDIGCITFGSSDHVHLAGQIQAADIVAAGLKRKIEQLREKAGKR